MSEQFPSHITRHQNLAISITHKANAWFHTHIYSQTMLSTNYFEPVWFTAFGNVLRLCALREIVSPLLIITTTIVYCYSHKFYLPVSQKAYLQGE